MKKSNFYRINSRSEKCFSPERVKEKFLCHQFSHLYHTFILIFISLVFSKHKCNHFWEKCINTQFSAFEKYGSHVSILTLCPWNNSQKDYKLLVYLKTDIFPKYKLFVFSLSKLHRGLMKMPGVGHKKKYSKNYLQLFSNAWLIRLGNQIKISLLLKTQWKQHHILYVKIVYKHIMTPERFTLKGERWGSLIKEKMYWSSRDVPCLVKSSTDTFIQR